jgi:lysophospholipid acyltransferase 1/2
MIEKVPSPLEYFSYVLNFQSLMAGPLVFYRDYIDFIEGYNIISRSNANVSVNFYEKKKTQLSVFWFLEQIG